MTMRPKLFLRCVAFCTARSYDIAALNHFFKRKGYLTKLSRDVLYVVHPKKAGDIFFFNHGSFVTWGLSRRQEQSMLNFVIDYSREPLAHVEIDHFCFRYGEEVSIDAHERFKLDMITLDSDNSQVKLAISYGLAQSIKLEAFEDSIQDAIKRNAHLPGEMSNRGIISLSRRLILKRIGEIFIARSSINLNSEYLDMPEFFWRNPNLEPFYMMTKKFLDIPSRVMALNQKLDVLQELLDILNSQVQHRHTSLLEMIIILLIFVEIVISLIHY